MANFELENAIAKMQEIRKSRRNRYGDGIFNKDINYFAFMIKEKVERLVNNEGSTDKLYETRLDILIDIMTYAGIGYESQLDKVLTEQTDTLKNIELRQSINGQVAVFLDGKFVGNTNVKNVRLLGWYSTDTL